MALFSLFIAPDAKNILQPEASFAGLAGKFVVSPIVYVIVFQHYRKEVLTWVNAIGRTGEAGQGHRRSLSRVRRNAIKKSRTSAGCSGPLMTDPFDGVRGGGGGAGSMPGREPR